RLVGLRQPHHRAARARRQSVQISSIELWTKGNGINRYLALDQVFANLAALRGVLDGIVNTQAIPQKEDNLVPFRFAAKRANGLLEAALEVRVAQRHNLLELCQGLF